jgi:hypothetical protein
MSDMRSASLKDTGHPFDRQAFSVVDWLTLSSSLSIRRATRLSATISTVSFCSFGSSLSLRAAGYTGGAASVQGA